MTLLFVVIPCLREEKDIFLVEAGGNEATTPRHIPSKAQLISGRLRGNWSRNDISMMIHDACQSTGTCSFIGVIDCVPAHFRPANSRLL